MTKNILITTDFTLESLQVLKTILREKKGNDPKYNIHFVIGYDRGDSIRDLLFETDTKILSKLKNSAFDEACAILKNKFDQEIHLITYQLFSGYFQTSFNQFIEAKQIDTIYYTTKKAKHINRNVFDLTRFIKKSKIDHCEILLETQAISHEKGKLSAFFT